MKISKYRALVHFLIVIALIALLLTGCGRNESGEPEGAAEQPEIPAVESDEPPELPPPGSFIIDFSDFVSSNNESSAVGGEGGGWQLVFYTQPNGDLPYGGPYAEGEQENWGFAALNVGLWSVILVIGLAVPVAAFVESFNHTPEQQPDYTWVWAYTVTVDNDLYTAELDGKFISEGVRWDMYISKEGGYNDFHWYYGESNLPATEGFWILKKSPSDPSDLLRIDWHRDISDGTSDIKYTNIVPGGPENGGYIFYGVVSGTAYDRFYEIYNKGQDKTTYIEWNEATQDGRVKDAQHFGDEEWHCWDSGHYDTECP